MFSPCLCRVSPKDIQVRFTYSKWSIGVMGVFSLCVSHGLCAGSTGDLPRVCPAPASPAALNTELKGSEFLWKCYT